MLPGAGSCLMQGRRLNAGRLWMNLKQLYGFLPVMLKCFKFGYNRQPAQSRRMSLVRPVDLTAVTGG